MGIVGEESGDGAMKSCLLGMVVGQALGYWLLEDRVRAFAWATAPLVFGR